MRKLFHVFLSLMIVYATTTSAFAAPSSWNITSAVSKGASTVVSATKGGYKNAVSVAPVAGRVAGALLKRANALALLYAAGQVLNDGIDFVMSPEGNAVQYKAPALRYGWSYGTKPDRVMYSGYEEAGRAACAPSEMWRIAERNSVQWRALCRSGGYYDVDLGSNSSVGPNDKVNKSVPVADIAAQVAGQVIDNASSNSPVSAAQRAAAQEVTKAAATEMVVAGDYDAQLQAGAVPNGSDSSTATGVAGAAAGQAASDALAAAEAARAASDAAKEAAEEAAEAARAASDAAADLVNSGADESAIEAAEAASKAAGVAANAAKDAAQAAADIRAGAAADSAAAARDFEKAARAAEVRAKQLADDAARALEDVAESASEAIKSAAKEAAKDAARALEDAKAVAELAKEAAKEAAKEKEEAKKEVKDKELSKPFELPAFCTWAAPVCEVIDYSKNKVKKVENYFSDHVPPEVPLDVPMGEETPDAPNSFDVSYINFGGQCPVLPSFSVGVGSIKTTMSFDIMPLCELAVMIRPAIIAMAYFIGLGVIASAVRES